MADKAPVTKLPLFSSSKTYPLSPVPGMGEDKAYAVVDIPSWEPKGAEGLGYIVEQLPAPRSVRVLAWIRSGSSVWPCDAPLDKAPEGTPLLRVCNALDTEDEGVVEIPGERHSEVIAQWSRCDRGGGRYLTSTVLSEGPGSYGSPDAHLDLRTLTAAGYLTYLEYARRARTSGADGGPQGAPVLERFLRDPLPDALDDVVWRGNPGNAQAGPLLRYAARSLELAGSAEVRPIVARTGADLVRLGSTHLWWTRFPRSSTSPEDRERLLAVEAALNRVQLVSDRLAAAGAPATDASVDAEGFAVLRGIADEAPRLMEAYEKHNPLASWRSVDARRGGEWDVRTRFARTTERLRLPFRLDHRFDCDPSTGVAAIEAAAPSLLAFPSTRYENGRVVDASGRRRAMAACYDLRLAVLLAACAFGSSVALTRVAVTVFEGGLGGMPVASVDFLRLPFLHTTLEAVRAGELSRGDDPVALARLLGQKTALRYDPARGLLPVEPVRCPQLAERRRALWEDDRALPDALRTSLRADKACELDVYHDEYPEELEEVRAIDEEERDSPIVAIMRLEELEDRLAQKLGSEPERLQNRHPLYCNSGLSRLLVGRDSPEATCATGLAGALDPTLVGDGGAPRAALGDSSRYYKLPDAFYEARVSLARRYCDIQEHARALATIEQCIALAPSSCPARLTKAVMLGDLERFDEAAAELKTLLTMLIDPEDTGFVFYRLAFACWRTGQASLGAACYVLAMATPRFAEQSRQELSELLAENSLEQPSREEAEAAVRAAGICIPLRSELLDSLARDVVGLVDAGFPLAAWRVVNYLADRSNSDDLHNVGVSLRDGCESAYLV